jgi:hypothetical protein
MWNRRVLNILPYSLALQSSRTLVSFTIYAHYPVFVSISLSGLNPFFCYFQTIFLTMPVVSILVTHPNHFGLLLLLCLAVLKM